MGLLGLPPLLIFALVVYPALSWAQTAPPEIVGALRNRDVYVDEAARSRLSEQAQIELEAYAARQIDQRFRLKLALLDRPPQGFRTLGQFVEAAHGALDLGDGILIAVALDSGAGASSVSAKTAALDDATVERLRAAIQLPPSGRRPEL